MRLRTQLTLAFLMLALVPVGAVGWAVLSAVTAELEGVFEARLTEARATARGTVERDASEVDAAVAALAEGSPPIRTAARRLHLGEGDAASLVPLAGGLLAGLDLDVLFLLDRDGRVLSSGHLPARFGYAEPALLEAVRAEETTLRPVEVRTREGITSRLALLEARPVRFGGQVALWVVGGRRLDAAWVTSLAQRTGGVVRLVPADGEGAVSAGALDTGGAALPFLPAPRPRTVEVPILPGTRGEGARLQLSVSDAPLVRARARVIGVLAPAAGVAVALALLVAGLLAARITRPVGALSAAARRIGAGDYDTRVPPQRSTGELSRLVETFNRMSEEIQASRQRIAAAERVAAWREVARRLAHEIKNPLMPIATSIDTLRRARARGHPQFDEIFDEATQAIGEEVTALKRIVDEFSRFARLPAPELRPVEPRALVEAALSLFPEPPEGIRLERRVTPGLPRVLADRDQLQQVLLNLLTNAVQAIGARAEGGRVVVFAEAAGPDRVALGVEDDGPGIPAEHRAQLFEPYFTTKETGTGLGLPICHRIVTEHSGRIEVESAPGRGARFTVSLPSDRPAG